MRIKPLSYYAFQLLYWCGIRSGELLALTPADFNFKKKTLRINKSYQRLQGKDVITTPKTKNSIRTVVMPQFLCDEMQDCLKLYYSLKPDDRIFPVTKYYLNHEIAVYGAQRSLFRFRTAAFRNITVVLQQSSMQVNGKGLSRHECPIDFISDC